MNKEKLPHYSSLDQCRYIIDLELTFQEERIYSRMDVFKVKYIILKLLNLIVSNIIFLFYKNIFQIIKNCWIFSNEYLNLLILGSRG